MKYLYCFIVLVCTGLPAYCQRQPHEEVNWRNPNLFSVKKISFHSDNIELDCKNCKCFEIRTVSGLTGLLVYGKGNFSLPHKHVKNEFNACLLRFNPGECDQLVKIKGKEKITDQVFYAASMGLLKHMFVRCYHKGTDALIPGKNVYAVDFATVDNEELLVSCTADTTMLYNFTTKKQY